MFMSPGSRIGRRRFAEATADWWDLQVPPANSFALASTDATLLTLTDDVNVGLLVDPGAVNATECVRWAYKTLKDKASAWDLVIRLRHWMPAANYSGIGVYLQDSTTNRTYKLLKQSDSRELQVLQYSDLKTFNAINSTPDNGPDLSPDWFRVTHDGTNYKFYVSAEGKLWSELYSVGNTAYLTGKADRVGFGALYLRGSGPRIVMSVPYFSLTGPGV